MNPLDFYTKDFVELFVPGLNTDSVVGYIENNLLPQFFPHWEQIEFGEMFEVQESDRIVEWHNDSKFGMNVTILYYMCDLSEETGGSISIRNGMHETKIYPKNGTMILMSQKPHVEHKAEYCSVPRHMFNIDYFVEGY